ncbi:transcriptional regulator [Mycolicibacterium chitae]|uniref:Transcriptional regulator n=1 Tax=Mycolicibacterium chitae TaxID=1792 RepID=A0A448I7P4_MYCCI|nr:TetR/AcrR family transcriptional regulator [Mycolicibacterium chitae]MCV7105836.1 TetR/AcrR family transcriptional regulator [Mycolicibacterium chitae]BBZ04685.1 transcriptional regulator [Mycolicibacterium chitae]VEG48315.1 transcriptional regulator [Mycolicibacterium chitae]
MHKIVDRQDYFSAAIDILAEADHGGLKLTPLCRRLEVTTGSFYHYFGSWARFKTELLEFWLQDRTLELAEAARRQGDPQRTLEALIDFACGFPHSAEAAIRAWSHSDQEVRQVQATVDEQRYRVTYETLQLLLDNDADAEMLARMAIFTLNGYQQTQPLPGVEHLRRSLNLVLTELLAPRAAVRP